MLKQKDQLDGLDVADSGQPPTYSQKHDTDSGDDEILAEILGDVPAPKRMKMEFKSPPPNDSDFKTPARRNKNTTFKPSRVMPQEQQV
jgi:hypothetical protein